MLHRVYACMSASQSIRKLSPEIHRADELYVCSDYPSLTLNQLTFRLLRMLAVEICENIFGMSPKDRKVDQSSSSPKIDIISETVAN
ncbi:hypothetical protein CEXT_168841 [Caerostris extrusa]|uniref:Uncharacterized protein n=1 Tax=Caerostris extrusa TaxID=172846 RepID=A0AAV4XFW5_CAEEX|nr:hypothetical protein CEXT_168841 [Caerostris extrusa]